MSYWVCVCVVNRFLFVHDVSELDDLFHEVFESDYVEHFLVDYDEEQHLNETGFYVFVHCRDYRNHVHALYSNRYVRNVLNSYSNVCVIPPDEVFATRKNPVNLVRDDEYRVNRSGFLLSGDVVNVTNGCFYQMQGVVLDQVDNTHYRVLFRLFVNSFSRIMNVKQLEFVSSLFKHHKFPVRPGGIRAAQKRIKHLVHSYVSCVRDSYEKRLVSDTAYFAVRLLDFDVVDVLHGQQDVCDLLRGSKQ